MILFAADAHGDFTPIIKAADKASAIILLGDQEPEYDLVEELGPAVAEKTWWIYGNHDSDDPMFIRHHESMAIRNLHCRIANIGGVKITGLGGTFSPEILDVDFTTPLEMVGDLWPKLSRHLKMNTGEPRIPTANDLTTIFAEDIFQLSRMAGSEKIDILVSHEAPESHPRGYQIIGDLARVLGVKMLVHGHHHERYDAIIDGGIRVVGVGLLGTPSMQTWTDEGLYWLDPETLHHKLVKGPRVRP
jgi:predicted phosphodiesterase